MLILQSPSYNTKGGDTISAYIDLGLTNEELVELYQVGDPDAMEALYEKNKGIIRLKAHNYKLEGVSTLDHDDLVQQGFLALVNAATKYNPDKGASFCHYLTFYLKKHMSRYLYNYNTYGKEISLFRKVGEGDDDTLESIIPDSNDYAEGVIHQVDNQILYNALLKALCKLSFLESDIIKKNYGFESDKVYTLGEIASICSLTSERIRQIRNAALKKLSRNKELIYYKREYDAEYLRHLNEKAFNKGNASRYDPFIEEAISKKHKCMDELFEQLQEQRRKDREEREKWMESFKNGVC